MDTKTKYPSTIEFSSSELRSKVESGRKARRPGGANRGSGHAFKTPSCTCGKNPCKCGTEAASKAMQHCNVNM